MISEILFALVSILTICSAAAIFISRRVIHAVIAVTFAFAGSAALFAYMNQVMLALLQLFIFVGGLSTYLMVAVASEDSSMPLGLLRFVFILVVAGIGISVILMGRGTAPQAGYAAQVQPLGASLPAYYPLIFAMVVLLFSGVMGSVVIIKKFVRLIV